MSRYQVEAQTFTAMSPVKGKGAYAPFSDSMTGNAAPPSLVSEFRLNSIAGKTKPPAWSMSSMASLRLKGRSWDAVELYLNLGDAHFQAARVWASKTRDGSGDRAGFPHPRRRYQVQPQLRFRLGIGRCRGHPDPAQGARPQYPDVFVCFSRSQVDHILCIWLRHYITERPHRGCGIGNTALQVNHDPALSARATCSLTRMKLSGVTEIESIPQSTRNRANSGWSLGP